MKKKRIWTAGLFALLLAAGCDNSSEIVEGQEPDKGPVQEFTRSVLKPFIKVNSNIAENSVVDYEKLTEISANDLSAKVAPTQSFFVEALQPTKELTIVFTPDMMTTGDYMEQQPAPQTKSKASGSTGISLSNIKAYAKDGEAVISASETIRSVQIVTAAGQVLASKQPNSTEVRMPLGQGMNIVKVQTENDVQTFKLMNN